MSLTKIIFTYITNSTGAAPGLNLITNGVILRIEQLLFQD